MRIFFDTNVLISAYTDPHRKGVCYKLTDFTLRSPRHQLVIADIVLKEFERVMSVSFKVAAVDIQAILFDLN